MSEVSAHYHLTRPAAVLRATGPDAFAFLQSQFSNDLRRPGVERPATYGLWLDRKGKIVADSFVIRHTAEDFLVLSYDCPAAGLLAHLEAHLVADEVALADATGEFLLLHAFSPEASAPDRRRRTASPGDRPEIFSAPPTPEIFSWDGRRPWKESAWDFLGPAEAMNHFAARLQGQGALPVGADHVQSLRVGAGLPAVPADAGPGDLPQETGLDYDAVSYTKGCFLGQEVMARLHAQGHVNRALWRVWLGDQVMRDAPAAPRLPLFAGSEAAGELRSRAGMAGLAMLKRRALAGREGLSLVPNGDEVVRLTGDFLVCDLTQPPAAPHQ